MKKIVIKLLSVLFVISLTASTVTSLASAMGDDELNLNSIANSSISDYRDQFSYDSAPHGLDFSYWAPKEEADTKYPLVIYIHGLFHGWTKTSYVKDSYMPYWASNEMQQKFEAGGAHILLLRMPEFKISAALTSQAKKTIEYYISKHQSVDTDRILLMGGSAGGGTAWRLLLSDPDFFSAAVILCATKVPTQSELEKVSDKPIWIISAKTDPLINYFANQSVTWGNISKTTNTPDNCRWTTFNNKVYFPDGKKAFITHFLAKTIGFGLLDFDGNALYNTTTVTAAGQSVNINKDGIVEWFVSNTCEKSFTDDTEEPDLMLLNQTADAA